MRHVTDDLTALSDGALEPERQAAVVRHLEGCASCRAERARIDDVLAALARLPPPPEVTPGFAARLEARLAAVRRPTGRERLVAWRWWIIGPAAVASALALFVATPERVARDEDLARHLELLEEYEVVAGLGDVETAEDAAIVAHLHELVAPDAKGKP